MLLPYPYFQRPRSRACFLREIGSYTQWEQSDRFYPPYFAGFVESHEHFSVGVLSKHKIVYKDDKGVSVKIWVDNLKGSISIYNWQLSFNPNMVESWPELQHHLDEHEPDHPPEIIMLEWRSGKFLPMIADEAYKNLRDSIENRDDIVIVCGAFNEPSQLDWTPHAFDLGWAKTPITNQRLGIPISHSMLKPTRNASVNSNAIPTRMDYIYYNCQHNCNITNGTVIGEPSPFSDIVLDSWESSHRGVLITLSSPKLGNDSFTSSPTSYPTPYPTTKSPIYPSPYPTPKPTMIPTLANEALVIRLNLTFTPERLTYCTRAQRIQESCAPDIRALVLDENELLYSPLYIDHHCKGSSVIIQSEMRFKSEKSTEALHVYNIVSKHSFIRQWVVAQYGPPIYSTEISSVAKPPTSEPTNSPNSASEGANAKHNQTRDIFVVLVVIIGLVSILAGIAASM
ncbi:hypothetical protein AAMO2058_001530500, partial [Amorphochlora amoebiformis]